MIVELYGKLKEKRDYAVIIDVHGLCYEVLVPASVMQRLDSSIDQNGNVHLKIYHYFQISPSAGFPMLIGFLSNVEKDFFQQFIKVSGIGPRAAVKALNQPISDITKAIDDGDALFLKTLPGIGMQRAKEIVAKLQGKVGRFGLIQDKNAIAPTAPVSGFEEEALDVLLQLQYKKVQAIEMIAHARKRNPKISSAEDLLNEIYQQRS